jgi:hypothetical protein
MIGALVAGQVGSGGAAPNSYESIATATGTGSSGTITFSPIPSGFKHLEIRGITRTDGTNAGFDVRLNSDSGSNYAQHELNGDGSAANASGSASTTQMRLGRPAISTTAANTHGVVTISILDYASTSKNKTLRSFSGMDDNSGTTVSQVQVRSGLWMSTSAVTSISIIAGGSANWTTTTTFALYGIKEF